MPTQFPTGVSFLMSYSNQLCCSWLINNIYFSATEHSFYGIVNRLYGSSCNYTVLLHKLIFMYHTQTNDAFCLGWHEGDYVLIFNTTSH